MSDSLDVLKLLDRAGSRSKIMFLVVNEKGADIISTYDEIDIISYPFSFSSTFLSLNVRSTIEESLRTTDRILDICDRYNKQAVIYISMAFGNPYGDPWSPEILAGWVETLFRMGVRTIPLSNVSMEISAEEIRQVFTRLISWFPEVDFGLHLHTANKDWQEKVDAAYTAGCRRFDGVIQGWGGCPMAGKELLGNLMTENLVSFAYDRGISTGLDPEAFKSALTEANRVYSLPFPNLKN
jgi:hydroxymethylglutaryl-CoA lyase